ncbi:MAG TPA: TRAP transporter small permease subunit [Hyphomicrobiaceae bacterium]|nr:TRAP transporter small permease subunit [Hyphomicrobiaceae bacterium]
MLKLLRFSRAVDAVNTFIGRMVSWFLVAAIVVSAVNATVRKILNTSSNAWLEIQWILFGAVFLLCASWTLIANEHIRIDIVNNMLPKRVRNWIDVCGHLFFLMPMAFVIAWLGWPFFWRSLMQNEQSTNAGGLPVYPSKLLIPLAFSLLFVQAISELIKRIAIMRGDLKDTSTGGGHHAAAEAEAERLLQAAREDFDKGADGTHRA